MIAKLLLVACAIVAPSLGSRLPYIIGGTTVSDATKWPWQGSFQYFGSHRCGCALISSTWAVTTAHCVGTPPSYYQIRFGTVDRREGGQVAKPKSIIVHEDWQVGPGSFPNDIAVISFSDVSTGSTVKPITIVSSETAGNSDCYITGWGYTTTGGGGELPTILQQAKINVYTNTECEKSWGIRINDGHVCLGDSVNGRASCGGDSGGPLVCKVDGSYKLVGVTSWGIAGCFTNYPSVYTRLTYFRSWIKEKTGV